MRYCEYCGTQLSPTDKFCPNCGAKAPTFMEDSSISNDLKQAVNTNVENASDRSRLVVLLLWFFVGGLGIHHFYAGNSGRGALILIMTLLCWLVIPLFIVDVLLIIDLVQICTGDFLDGEGRKIVKW